MTSEENAAAKSAAEANDQPIPETVEHEVSEAEEVESSDQDSVNVEAENVTDWQDKYLRLYAEFDNFRKRSMRERGDLIRNASMDVLEKMLPVLDDFDRAASAPGDDLTAVKEGQALIHTKFRQLLEAQGLKKMEVAQGDLFDVDLHEAITNIPAPSQDLVGKVVDVVEPGYKLNDKIMRYAKVVVGQ